MEKIENGKLIISKGSNIVIVETAYYILKSKPRKRELENELYTFVDGLVGKGYEILNSSRTIYFSGDAAQGSAPTIGFDDRWVLKSPK
jgi:hypothetical protein